MAFFMYFSFVPMALLGLFGSFLALCVVELVRAVTLPPGVGDHPACGGCGYQIIELPQEGRCPDCGAALAKAGLLTRRAAMRFRGTTYGLVVGWTTLFVTVTLPVGGLVLSILMANSPSFFSGGPMGLTKTQTFAPPQQWDAGLGEYVSAAPYRVDFDIDVVMSNAQNATTGTIEVAIRVGEQAESAKAVIDVEGGCDILSPQGESVAHYGIFDDLAARELYEAAGLDTKDKQVTDESAALSELVQSAITMPYYFEQSGMPWNPGGAAATQVFSAQGGQMSYQQIAGGNAPWVRISVVMGTFVLIFLVLYVVGLVLLLRRRRRLLAI